MPRGNVLARGIAVGLLVVEKNIGAESLQDGMALVQRMFHKKPIRKRRGTDAIETGKIISTIDALPAADDLFINARTPKYCHPLQIRSGKGKRKNLTATQK